MTEGNGGKTKRAMITVSLPNTEDAKVLEIKQLVEQTVQDIPDAAVDLRMGTVPNRPSPPNMLTP